MAALEHFGPDEKQCMPPTFLPSYQQGNPGLVIPNRPPNPGKLVMSHNLETRGIQFQHLDHACPFFFFSFFHRVMSFVLSPALINYAMFTLNNIITCTYMHTSHILALLQMDALSAVMQHALHKSLILSQELKCLVSFTRWLAHMLVNYAASNNAAIVTSFTLIKILGRQQRWTLKRRKVKSCR